MGGKGEKPIVYRSRSVSDENYYTQKLRTSRFTRRITLQTFNFLTHQEPIAKG